MNPVVTLDVSGTAPVPLTRLVAVELRKMSDTRAGKWLLIVIGLITVLAVGLLVAVADQADRTFDNFLSATWTPQGMLLPVLGILLVTSEWGQRAHLTTFTLVPARGRTVAAKCVAAVLYGLAALVFAVLVAALAALVGGATGPWGTFGVTEVVKIALAQTLGVLQGVAFGLFFLNSAAAIVAFFVVPVVFSVATSLVEQLRELQPWIDLSVAQAALFETTTMTGEQWAQIFVTSLLWIVLPAAIGTLRVLRSEVK